MKNIVLLGFMGAGKTAVAKALARKLKKEYVSTDTIIEKKEGMSISEIFSKKGEPYFRKQEEEVAKELSNKQDLIIDTGGGIVLNPVNIENLSKNGVLVCLDASADAILERTKKYSHRPLLSVDDPKAKVEELLKQRAPFYGKIKIHIDTSKLSVSEVVEKIEHENN